MQQVRILWADQAKALAISLMILCHYGLSEPEWVKFIYIFHIPVFFFISGYFDKGRPFSKELLKKNFKTLMVPYFFFSICAFTICWISPYIHPELYNNDGIGKTFLKAFVGMFLMQDEVHSFAFMPFGPLWFLVALFEVKVAFSLFVVISKRYSYLLGGIVVALLYLVGTSLTIPFFSLNAAVMAIPIYGCGYIVKKYNLIECITGKWQSCLLALLGIVYLALIAMMNGKVSMDGMDFGNSIVMFYINAVIGSVTIIFMFKAIDVKWTWLSVVGASTLTILGTHGYISILGRVVGIKLLSIDFSCPPLWYALLLTFIGIGFGVICHKLLMKYIPAAIGKK